MLVSEFDFALPPGLIAQRPPTERGASRMLHMDRRTGAWRDGWFRDLPEVLGPGDLLVLNDTRVLPGRLFAMRAGVRTQAGSGAPRGVVEVLLTELVDAGPGGMVWDALVKPAKKVPVGERLLFADVPGGDPLLRAEVIGAGEFGQRRIRFEPLRNFHAVLERIGHLPLPPYIRRERGKADSAEDRERYQTVYSRSFGAEALSEDCSLANPSVSRKDGASGGSCSHKTQIPSHAAALRADDNQRGNAEGVAGSAAAPTAGLHFTEEVLGALAGRGVEIARVTLHVGLGTFQPVRVEKTEEIRLHAEPYTLSEATAEALNRAWGDGRRIVAVGTTTTRTVEHVARVFEGRYGALGRSNPLRLEGHSGSTGLFLSPEGDDAFKLVGGLLTNFHLPQSTLLMLVSAFAGRKRVLAAYGHAVKAGYRFFSYGDCMLVL